MQSGHPELSVRNSVTIDSEMRLIPTVFKGPSKYKNERQDVALLCYTMRSLAGSKQCWIYDDAKKKVRKFRAKTKD